MANVSDVYTQASRLEVSLTELYTREKEFERACVEAAEAEHAYKIKQAREYLAAEGTEKARSAASTIACEKEHLIRVRTEAIRDFTKVNIVDSQQALSARQSLLRFEMGSDDLYSKDRRTT